MSIKFNNYWNLVDELDDQIERSRSFDAEGIIHHELLRLVANCHVVEALLINRLICRSRSSCYNAEQGECPFNRVCYTSESNFRGCDRYTLEHPNEALEIAKNYINKEGLEL